MASSSSMDDPVVDQEYRAQIDRASHLLHAFMGPGHLKQIKPQAQDWLRLAWNDAGTYNVQKETGGANGSIMHCEILKTQKDSNLGRALQLIEGVKLSNPKVTYADIIQLAGIVAVKVSGGPAIEFVPGRKDSLPSPDETQFPDNNPGLQLSIFHRMGLSDDRDIVPLIGGLTLGRAFRVILQHEDTQSVPPMKFDNSYFVNLLGPQPLADAVERAVLENPNLQTILKLYAEDKNAFFEVYAAAHKKFSELGFKPSSSEHNVEGQCSTSLPPTISSDHNAGRESSTVLVPTISTDHNGERERRTVWERIVHNADSEPVGPGVVAFFTFAAIVGVLCYYWRSNRSTE